MSGSSSSPSLGEFELTPYAAVRSIAVGFDVQLYSDHDVAWILWERTAFPFCDMAFLRGQILDFFTYRSYGFDGCCRCGRPTMEPGVTMCEPCDRELVMEGYPV